MKVFFKQQRFHLLNRGRVRVHQGTSGIALAGTEFFRILSSSLVVQVWNFDVVVCHIILHTQAESGAFSRNYSRPVRRPHVPPNRHRVSPGFIRSRNCVPIAFTGENPLAQGRASPQSSSSNGCCLFRFPRGSFFYAPLFSDVASASTSNVICKDPSRMYLIM